MKTSKSKTFSKDTDFGEVISWFTDQIETNDYQPEGVDWSGGEPGPIDPRCDLVSKYIITVTKVTE
jgi:hypothetical protein